MVALRPPEYGVSEHQPIKVQIAVEVEVTNGPLLIEAVRQKLTKLSGDPERVPEDLADAVLQNMLASCPGLKIRVLKTRADFSEGSEPYLVTCGRCGHKVLKQYVMVVGKKLIGKDCGCYDERRCTDPY